MGAAIRLKCCTDCPIRFTVPNIDATGLEASRRLDALETLTFNEPDPKIHKLFVRRFNEIWEELTETDRRRCGK